MKLFSLTKFSLRFELSHVRVRALMKMSLKMPRQRTNKYLAGFPVETFGVSTLLLGKSYVQKCLVGCLIFNDLSSNFLRLFLLSKEKRIVAIGIFFLEILAHCVIIAPVLRKFASGFNLRWQIRWRFYAVTVIMCIIIIAQWWWLNTEKRSFRCEKNGTKTEKLNEKEQYLHWHRTDEST